MLTLDAAQFPPGGCTNPIEFPAGTSDPALNLSGSAAAIRFSTHAGKNYDAVRVSLP